MTWFNDSFAFDRAFVLMAIDVSLKVTIVAAVVLLILKALRTRDSTIMHRAYFFILLSMLLMPALAMLAPRVPLPLPTQLALVPDSIASIDQPSDKAAGINHTEFIESATTNQPSQPVVTQAVAVPDQDQSRAATSVIAPESKAASKLDLLDRAQPINWLGYVPFIILFVYGVVASAILLRVSIGLVKCRSLLNRARLIPSEDLPEDMNSDHVVMECDDLQIPVAAGLWRPRIVLPADWRNWGNNEVAMALAHESEHIARGDTLVSFLAALNCAFYWFHPLSWSLARRLFELAEHACDDAVISETGNRSAYALKLVSLASRITHTSVPQPLSVAMARQPLLEKRVMRIVDCNRPLSTQLGWLKSSVLAVAVLALAFVAGGISLDKAAIADDKAAAQESKTDQSNEPKNHTPESTGSNDTSTISGRVLSPSGEGVSGADVRLFTWPEGRQPIGQLTKSGPDGRFTFDNLKEGRHVVAAYADDLASRTKRHEGQSAQAGQQDVVLMLQKAPSLEVKVVDHASGKPVSKALVRLTWSDIQQDHLTDEQGRVTIKGMTPEIWTIEVQAKGYAEREQAISVTGNMTETQATLDPGFELSGKVVDEAGAPISGVGVSVFPLGAGGSQIEYMVTAEDGIYRFPYLPLSGVQFITMKDGYKSSDKSYTPASDQPSKQVFDLTLAALPDGGSLVGSVQDKAGKPIPGATIANGGDSSDFLRTAVSDASGGFRLDNVYKRNNQHSIVVRATGFAPQILYFTPGTKEAPNTVVVSLGEGASINGRVVDTNGNAIEGVSVEANGFGFLPMFELNVAQTDKDGHFVLASMLDRATFNFGKRGYAMARNVRLPLNIKEEVTYVLKENSLLHGKVIDEQTGEPIASFKVQSTIPPGSDNGTYLLPPSAALGQTFANKDGVFELKDLLDGTPLQMTISADGYQRLVNPSLVIGPGRTNKVFLVRRLGPAGTVAGQITTSDGKPLAAMQVRLIATEASQTLPSFEWRTIKSTELERQSSITQLISATTDSEGRFKFDQVQQGQRIQLAYWGNNIMHDHRYGIEDLSSDERQKITIKAIPAGAIVGSIGQTKLPANVQVIAHSKDNDFYIGEISQDGSHYEVRNLPAGEYNLTFGTRAERPQGGAYVSTPIENVTVHVKSGETAVVDILKN